MHKILLCCILVVSLIDGMAQHTVKLKVIDADSKTILAGASIQLAKLSGDISNTDPLRTGTVVPSGYITDSSGSIWIRDLVPGKYRLDVSFVGYETGGTTLAIPGRDSITLELEPSGEEEEEVIVQSTRTSRTIRNVPTRFETIGLEEIDEKSNMRPANISMLLHESTGIQVQQTSATSANSAIRIQGLDGRYTQMLKNGFSNYGNFASGLSVLEIPPLDLQQVEIIKGPASTLYGGGAIAGVINLVSRTPGNKRVNEFMLNQSNVGQSNLGWFSSARTKKAGYTMLALYNRQQAYDVDKDDFTELPRTREFTINPTLFLYLSDRTTLSIGNSFTKAERTGGDIQVIKKKADLNHTYYEENNTIRNITTLDLKRSYAGNDNLNVKQAFSVYDRHIGIPGYHFDGTSYNSFTDVSYLSNITGHSIVTGANFVYDRFNEKKSSAMQRDNTLTTAGIYVQDTWDVGEKTKLESGLRLDRARYSNNRYGNTELFLLPRISLLVKYNEALTSRIGGGLGYKTPTLFTERTENFQYRMVQQLDDVKSERSYGFTGDLDLKKRLSNTLSLSFNQLFFFTTIRKPLITETNTFNEIFFVNVARPVQSKGFETNAKLIYRDHLKLFLGYTYTDTRAKYLTGNQFLPLVPKHRFNSALIYEKHEFLKVGLEGYYTSRQFLYNGFRTQGFWELGFMAEKLFEHFSVYINFENFTDTRQSRYKPVVSGNHTAPEFDDIWTHTEGFVLNGGIKIRL